MPMFRSPQLVLQMLFSPRIEVFELDLTNKFDKNELDDSDVMRINEDDISKSLAVIDQAFSRS